VRGSVGRWRLGFDGGVVGTNWNPGVQSPFLDESLIEIEAVAVVSE
jgi:hypothetical protein